MGRPSILLGLKNPKKALRFILNQKDLKKSKKEFGNVAGYSRNIEGRKNIANASKKCQINQINDERISKMKNKQVLHIGMPFNRELMNKIKKKYDEVIENDEFSLVGSEHEGKVYSRRILNAHVLIPELAELLNDEIIQLIENYYNSHFTVKYLICWRNYHVPDSVIKSVEMFSDRWHCDEKSTDFFKLFVNLSDITEDDGPFNIINIIGTKKVIGLGFGTRFDYKIPDETLIQEGIRATGKLGTAMLCNTELCLHKAGIPKEGHTRDIIQFQFIPTSKPLEKDWIKKVDLKPNEKKYNSSMT